MTVHSLSDHLRPGDRVLIGQVAGEPVGLVADLFDAAQRIKGLEVFCGFSLNPAWRGDVPDEMGLSTYCGLGAIGPAVADGRARVIPASLSQLSALIASRSLKADVVLLQVSPADEDGWHSLGCTIDYVWEAAQQARVVVVEVNEAMPMTHSPGRLHGSEVVIGRRSATPLPVVNDEPPGDAQRAVAEHVATLVPDGAAIQLGIGGLAAAVAGALDTRRDLKIRSGMVGDWMLDLMQARALDTQTPDACLASLAVGSERLYDSLSRDGLLGFAPPSDLVMPMPDTPLMAINSAIEVDLMGQVNAELIGDRYIGTVGGQTDYFRAARRSAGGLAIVALPSASGRGHSRIVRRCTHVSTAQSEVDMIVTEHGIADLRATTLAERAARIAAIADPRHRDGLSGPGRIGSLA